MDTEKMLSIILKPLREDYDYIRIDTSPFLGGALTINAMVADEREKMVSETELVGYCA